MKVVATGTFSFSAKSINASEARSRMTPLPAMITGAFAFEIMSATCAHLPAGAVGIAGILHPQGCRVSGSLGAGNVLGKVDEAGAGLLGLRGLECLAHDLGDHLRGADLGRVLGDRVEEVHQVEDLVALLVHPCRRALTGDRDQRRAIHVSVGDAGHEVGGAGAEGRKADPGTAGQPAIDIRDEGGALLVPGWHELHRGVDQRVEEVDVLLARDAEDIVDAFVLEAAREELAPGQGGFLPFGLSFGRGRGLS